MAFVPQVAFAASLGKRMIVCGDFKQLPPIASAHHSFVSEWLKEDIFHKAGVTETIKEGKLHPHLFLLKEQRRMHPDISSFTNKYIYQSLVGDHKNVAAARQEIVAKHPFPNRASHFARYKRYRYLLYDRTIVPFTYKSMAASSFFSINS